MPMSRIAKPLLAVPLLLALAGPVFAQAVSFAPATSLPAGPAGVEPVGLAARDINGDAKRDLVVTLGFTSPGYYSVLLGSGSGNFGPANVTNAGAGALGVAIGDFNADGKPDLAITQAGSHSVLVLLGNGAGGFPSGMSYPVGFVPTSVAVVDSMPSGCRVSRAARARSRPSNRPSSQGMNRPRRSR